MAEQAPFGAQAACLRKLKKKKEYVFQSLNLFFALIVE